MDNDTPTKAWIRKTKFFVIVRRALVFIYGLCFIMIMIYGSIEVINAGLVLLGFPNSIWLRMIIFPYFLFFGVYSVVKVLKQLNYYTKTSVWDQVISEWDNRPYWERNKTK